MKERERERGEEGDRERKRGRERHRSLSFVRIRSIEPEGKGFLLESDFLHSLPLFLLFLLLSFFPSISFSLRIVQEKERKKKIGRGR